MVVIANMGSPKAVILIDPVSGLPYKAFSAPAAGVVVCAHINSPKAAVLLDPTTGLPYVA